MKYSVNKDTITRTIINAIALINAVLIMFDKIPLNLDDNLIYTLVSGLSIVVANTASWWKNNSFTQPALKADEYLKGLKGDVVEKTN